MGLFLTDESCIRQREYVNIPVWHRKGYTGKGLVVFHDDLGNTSHSGACVDIIKTILPDARVLSGRIGFTTQNKKEVARCTVACNETKETLTFDDFVLRHEISQINNSTTGGSDDPESPIASYMREKIKQYNLFCTAAAGNFGTMRNRFYGAFVMVTGLHLAQDGKIIYYGLESDDVDFSMFMGFQSGTSFAAPFLNGMAGLIRSKYGRDMTQGQIYEYFREHCQELGTPGKDPRYGWGVPILGSPETVIKMWPGENVMVVDGREVTLDQAPEIVRKTGRTLVPIRAVSEALGATVEWDEKTKTITILR